MVGTASFDDWDLHLEAEANFCEQRGKEILENLFQCPINEIPFNGDFIEIEERNIKINGICIKYDAVSYDDDGEFITLAYHHETICDTILADVERIVEVILC